MKYLSVCSGIEAATVAWHPLGWEPVAFAEIEAFPAAVLAHHYPGVPNLGDMTKINGEQYRDVDVLVGGTPCQAFSIAGLRKGLVDPRGNLTLAFAKLADDMQVPWVVWENVPGVLSSKDNAFGCFLGFLAGETVPLLPPGGRWADAGYVLGPQRAIAWRVLDAQYFGLAQRRRRVFVVASAREGFDPAKVLFEFDGVRRDTAPSREAGKTPAGTIEASLGRSRGAGTQAGALTHDVAPCLAASGRGFERAGETRGQDPVVACLNGIAEYRNVSGTLNTNSNPSGRNTPMVVRAFKVRCGCEGGGKGYLGNEDIAFTLSTGADQYLQHGTANALLTPNGGRGGTAGLAFAQNTRDEVRLQGGDGQIVGALAANPGMKQTTYVTAPAVAFRDPSPTLTNKMQGSSGWAPYNEDAHLVGQHMQVRRLTPRECERLQGFPDDYTLIPWKGKPAEDCPDGPRYKALGNSMAVPVVRWIGQRIQSTINHR